MSCHRKAAADTPIGVPCAPPAQGTRHARLWPAGRRASSRSRLALKLATLRCAAECLTATFDGISHWPALEHARDLLMIAAETGKRRDVTATTEQIAVVLGQRNFSGD